LYNAVLFINTDKTIAILFTILYGVGECKTEVNNLNQVNILVLSYNILMSTTKHAKIQITTY